MVCDEGSSLVRLFGQLFFEEDEEIDENSPGLLFDFHKFLVFNSSFDFELKMRMFSERMVKFIKKLYKIFFKL